MDEQQYEEYEEGYYEPRSNKWLWILLILIAVAAIVFGVLWYLRGGEIARLTSAMQSAQSTADTNAQRLQRDLDSARAQTDANATKITELENSLRDEQRRGAETAQQVERRMRDEVLSQSSRLQAANAELEDLRSRLAEATEGVAAGTSAQERLEAAQAQLTEALAGSARAAGLEKELSEAKAAISKLEMTVGDLEASKNNIGLELTTANEDLRKADADRKELAEVKAQLERTRAELAKAQSDHAELTKSSGQLNRLMSSRGQELDAAKTLEKTLRAGIAELETKYAAARKELSEKTRTAEGLAAGAQDRTGELQTRLEQTQKRAETAESALEEMKKAAEAAKQAADEAKKAAAAQADELHSRLTEAGKTIVRLEEKVGDLEANHSSLSKELTSASDDLRAAEESRDKLRKAFDEAKKQAERAEKALADRADETDKALKDREKELREDFERQKGEWQKQLEAIKRATEQARAKQAAQPETAAAPAAVEPAAPAANPPVAPVAEPMADAPAPEPEVSSAQFEEPRHVIMGDPMRAAGRVAQVMPDGLTYIIDGGTNQRVKPGMVFDVHRRFGSLNRYVGLLRVTQALDDFSMAVPAYPSRDARVCPVTGRVILDPAKNFSPYAESDEGRPVPLISASSLGLGQDMPVVGDYIDNPYYDPERAMVFSAAPEVNGDARAAALVEGLGGLRGEAGMPSDFQVVRNVDPKVNPHARPQQVTVDALGGYVEPVYAGL